MHLIYYGRDGNKAKELAAESRQNKVPAQVRDAAMFRDAEKADKVTILPCATEFDIVRIERAYPDAEIMKGKTSRPPITAKKIEPKPEKQTVKIDKSEQPAAVADDADASRRGAVDIPEGWETMPFMSKRALARRIAGNSEPSIAAEVDSVIAAEIARRKV